MLFYIFIFIICVFVPLLSKNKIAEKIPFLILWFIYAFRDNVGVDDNVYINAFNYIKLGWTYDIEKSFKILVNLSVKLGLNYKFLFLIYATLSILFLYKAVNILFESNRKKAIFMACFFGTVFISSMSVMRQFLASTICFYAFSLLLKNNSLKKPLMLSIFAIFFHGAAIISLPFIIFSKKFKLKYSTKIIIIIISMLFGYFQISNLILNTLVSILPKSYQIYSNSMYGSFSSAGGMLSILMCALFIIQCFFSIKNENNINNNTKNIILENGQLIYLCILFFFVHAGVASRLAFTFIPFMATIPITIIDRIKRPQQILINFLLITSMLLLFIIGLKSVSKISNSNFIPYNYSFNFNL